MNYRALLAEFVGTFALVFVGIGAIAMDHISGGKSGLTGIALANGFVIAVFASACMTTSGSQFNPAVTISLFCARKINASDATAYIITQCVASLTAAAMVYVCFPLELLKTIGHGTPAVGLGIPISMALITEIVMTFFLMFVIYGVAVESKRPDISAIFIGLTVTLDILIGGPISGGAMNPARHFGPALLGGGLQNIWLYWVGPIIGSILAAIVYKFMFQKSNKESFYA